MCHRYGIPHGFFLGGAYRWSEADRAKALLFAAWKAQECPRCHTRKTDWETDPDWRVADFEHCEGCARLDELQEQVKQPRPGTFVTLLPKNVVEARLEEEEQANE